MIDLKAGIIELVNYNAIATVTATMRDILQDNLQTSFQGITVTAKPLDILQQDPPANRLNIFLYHISPNLGYLNSDIQMDNPVIALNLYYLLTATTSDSDDLYDIKPQQILAKAVLALSKYGILTKEDILSTRTSPNSKILDTNDKDHLESQLDIESIKFYLNYMSLDEMVKIWSSGFQLHYRPSISYLVTTILLQNKQEVQPAYPVQDIRVYVLSQKQPVINNIEPTVLEFDLNSEFNIYGTNLSSSSSSEVDVVINDVAIDRALLTSSDDKINVKVPSTITSGIKVVKVHHHIKIRNEDGTFFEPKTWGYSNMVTFSIVPKIIDPVKISVRRGDLLQIKIQPGVMFSQSVNVFIGNYAFDIVLPHPNQILGIEYPMTSLPPLQIPSNIPLTSETLNLEPYLLRVRVDGVDSLVRRDNSQNSVTFNQYIPSVEVVQ